MLAIPAIKCGSGLGDSNSFVSCLLQSEHLISEEVVTDDFASLQKYRTDATCTIDSFKTGKQFLLQYFHQLTSFASRFVGLEAERKLNLNWGDAFDLSLQTSSKSFYLDIACCLWNLAAIESRMGVGLRSSEEELKAANKHFQQAAGFIETIRQRVLPHLPPLANCPCLSSDSLCMVSNLMLAQAQLCYFEQAVKHKLRDSTAMKASIIAKLAKQLSVYYYTTSIACAGDVLSSVLDTSWYAVTAFQSKYFQGAAEYWQARALQEAAQTAGEAVSVLRCREQVARCLRAETAVEQALAQAAESTVAESLLMGAQELRIAIQQVREAAELHLEPEHSQLVSEDLSLQEVGCLPMVRALMAIPEPDGEPLRLLFQYVLPPPARQASARFREEISAVCAATVTVAEAATTAARLALSAQGLPGSLEATQGSETEASDPLPLRVWESIQRVQALGGSFLLASLFEDLQGAACQTLQSMAAIDDCLDREERADEAFRGWGSDFPGTTSRDLGADVRANNAKMRDAHRSAQASDEQVEKDLTSKTTQAQLAMAAKTREQLLELFPRVAPSGDIGVTVSEEGAKSLHSCVGSAETAQVRLLEEKLHALAALIESRGQDVAALQKMVALDVTELANAALSKSQDVAAVLAKHLQEGQGIQLRVNQGVSDQETLLVDILTLNDAVCEHRLTDPLSLERNKVIQEVEQAAAKFLLLHSHITAGLAFYSRLQANLTTLMRAAEDLELTQQWRRQDYGPHQGADMLRYTQELADRDLAIIIASQLAVAEPAPAPAAPAPAAIREREADYWKTWWDTPQPDTANVSSPSTRTVRQLLHQQQQQYPQQLQQHPPLQGSLYLPPSPSAPPATAPAETLAVAAVAVDSEVAYGALAGAPSQRPLVPSHSTYYEYEHSDSEGTAAPSPEVKHVTHQQQPLPQPMLASYQQQRDALNGSATFGNMQSQQQQQQLAARPSTSADMHAKTLRLCELGFRYEQVTIALLENGRDEEAALNALLAGHAASKSSCVVQ